MAPANMWAPIAWKRPLVAGLLLLSGCGVGQDDRQPAQARDLEAPPASRPLKASNVIAASTSSVDLLRDDRGLAGQGLIAGQWDDGAARATHVDFGRRVRSLDPAWATDHATHVAGGITGSGASAVEATGVAGAATLWSLRWDFDALEMRQLSPYLAVTAHAYGMALGWESDACPDGPAWLGGSARRDPAFGRYGPLAAELDAVLVDSDAVSVWAIGNERWDAGPGDGVAHFHYPDCATQHTDNHDDEAGLVYGTLGGRLSAKNSLVVGAAADIAARPVTPQDIVALGFSGFGPTADGRIRPDIVASGQRLFSTLATHDSAHGYFDGTSQATGVTSGTVLLLTEHYRALLAGRDPGGAEMRALLVHTAAQPSPAGPSYGTGHGLLDAAAAAAFLDLAGAIADQPRAVLNNGVMTQPGAQALRTGEVGTSTALRVTLAWTDPPGAPIRGGADAGDATASTLRNDLDVTLIAPDGETRFYPWRLDANTPDAPATRDGENHIDNIEVIDVDADDNTWTGQWTVEVSVEGELHRGRPQAFALLTSAPVDAPEGQVLASTRRVHMRAGAGVQQVSAPLSIASVGTQPLAWALRPRVPWLQVDTVGGTTPATVQLTADVTALPGPGDYLALVDLSTDAPAGDRVIGVVISVTCAPDCAGRECGPDPVCGSTCGTCPGGNACDAAGLCAPWVGGCPEATMASLGADLLSGTTLGANDDSAGSCGGQGAQDVATLWTAPAAGTYVFSTGGSDFDTVLYLRDDACDGAELDCNDDTHGQSSTVAATLPEGARVVVVVDGAATEGLFSLHVWEAQCPSIALGSQLGPRIAGARTDHGADVHSGSCGGDATPEHALSWVAPADGQFEFVVDGLPEGAALYLRDLDCAGSELACELPGQDATAHATVELVEGQAVAIVVEAPVGQPFGLAITSPLGPCVADCDGSPDLGGCYCDGGCFDRGDCCDGVCLACGHGCDLDNCEPDGCATTERCDRGTCVPEPCLSMADGDACDDGDACTDTDVCIGGRCAGAVLTCEGVDYCGRAACEPGVGCPNRADGEDPCDAGVLDADAGADGGLAPADSSGCGCRITGGPTAPLPGFAGLLLALALWQRRTRRPRRRGARSVT